MRIDELVSRYLAWVQAKRSLGTYLLSRTYLTNLANRLGELQAESLNVGLVEDWLDNGCWTKPNTILIGLARLDAMYTWGIKREFVTKNPIKGKIDKPAGTSRSKDCLITQAQLDLLVRNAQPAFAKFLLALWETGCRPSELASLRAEHYVPEKGIWVLKAHKTAYHGHDRIIFLSPLMIELTNLLLPEADPYIFKDWKGHRWTNNRWVFWMRRLVRRVGLPTTVTCYSCRHSFAVRLLEKGTSIYDVAQLMGHRSVKMVEKHYGHYLSNTGRLSKLLV